MSAVCRHARVVQVVRVAQIPEQRVRAAKHAPRGPFRVLERRHGFAEIVERGAGVL